MSFAELKEKVAVLSAKERHQLAAFLAEIEGENEVEYRALMDKRMKAMDAGKKVTEAELLRRHKKLLAKGR